mgnify:CR=1 FL=1
MSYKLNWYKFKKNDNYSTPIEYLKAILPYIPKNLTINDPFYFNGLVKKNWKMLGVDIIHKDEDFFKIEKDDKKEIYVSNPPFSILNKVLKHLFYLDKPFILLIPLSKIARIKIQRILRRHNDYLQLIISPIYKGFIDANNINTANPSQYFTYLCYKTNLKRDLNFIV